VNNYKDWGKNLRKFVNKYFSTENDKVVIKNILAAFIIKGGSLIISLLTLPAFIRYFDNQEVLGVWFTILSVLTWVLTFDMGIGNGLRNKLVGAIVRKNQLEIRRNLSSAYFIIGAMTLFVIFLSVIVFPYISWNTIFNISESLVSSGTMLFVVMCAFITIMLQFFLRLISFVLYALQKSAINNLIALITSLLILVFVLLAPSFDLETNLKILSIVYLLCVNLPLIIATIYIFTKELKGCYPSISYINNKSAREIMALGGVFFWNQIMYTAITQTNLILITYFVGPGSVVEYQIYYQLFMLSGTLFNLALTPLWSAITKAFEEKDGLWINKYFKTLNLLVIIVAIFLFLFIPCMQLVVNLWLGQNSINVDNISAVIFASYGSIFIFHNVLSTFASGLGKMKLQAYFYTFGVIFKLIFVYFVTSLFTDWNIIVIADIIILAPYCLVQWIVLKRQFSKYTTVSKKNVNFGDSPPLL
jgi:O-antigen/teichoic acid export membrane protein